MPLVIGTLLGTYEIVAAIGAGGMGEVYRARDTRLNRDVAIKVLPDSFATDPEPLARFEREAQVLASLNHPNIAHIHGLEESGGLRALVMELVEGEDLSRRIARGAVPIDEALPIAKQIAEALEAAHEHGIVHRDLKPANVKVTPDGTVKVLDFGLAKALGEEGGGASFTPLSHSPTMTNPGGMTGAGVILGTAAYMSPEQAKGKPVDKRADIWAFGCVLYEMLAGRRAFDGENVTDIIVAVVSKEPDLAALPPGTPASIHRLLRRALSKDRKGRLPDIGVARLEIADSMGESSATANDRRETHARATAGIRRERIAWISAAVCVIVAVAVVVARYLEPTPASHGVVRFDVELPERSGLGSNEVAISPDGRQLVFRVQLGSGVPRLWVRALDSPATQPLQGAEGASNVFWAPDSRSIGFFADGKLKRDRCVGRKSSNVVRREPCRRGGDVESRRYRPVRGRSHLPCASRRRRPHSRDGA
ncbi:MAG: hypothetical protein A3H97_20675 [Acidobacteria bacterium RIFCSPLOWO2_02_FULL_65_29]|nr:MAG: hypothetical protein A3H97_20675 [Acidobacteria bacterium RIFCSPLOWO2_02_FULL_65_29]